MVQLKRKMLTSYVAVLFSITHAEFNNFYGFFYKFYGIYYKKTTSVCFNGSQCRMTFDRAHTSAE